MPLILLIIGVVLIIYNYRAIRNEQKYKPEDSGFNISFQSVLQDSKEEMNDYKMEIGLLRKDMAESLTELQEEIFDMKKDIHRLKSENYHRLENKEVLENNYLMNESKVDISINGFDEILEENNSFAKEDSNKTATIKRLLGEGLTEEQICHELSVSKGEVLLVKGLFKK